MSLLLITHLKHLNAFPLILGYKVKSATGSADPEQCITCLSLQPHSYHIPHHTLLCCHVSLFSVPRGLHPSQSLHYPELLLFLPPSPK